VVGTTDAIMPQSALTRLQHVLMALFVAPAAEASDSLSAHRPASAVGIIAFKSLERRSPPF